MEVIIDSKSGFCFGVKKAISLAENELKKSRSLYCLGDIVHNEKEVERLASLGLKVISREDFFTLSHCKVLLRAHGEPPEIYNYAREKNIELIDGTCTVVNKLQQKIKVSYDQLPEDATLIIFGKPEHPEVLGLNGQINYKAVVVQDVSDLTKINYTKPVVLYCQTTMSRQKYLELKIKIEERIQSPDLLESYDTICGQVANRGPWLQEFSQTVDAVVFVGGKKSSNSRVLYSVCKEVNPNSFFVTSGKEAIELDLNQYNKIGICGATSTPVWLLNEVAKTINNISL